MLDKLVNSVLRRQRYSAHASRWLVALAADDYVGNARRGQPLQDLRTGVEQYDEVYRPRQRDVKSRIVEIGVDVVKHRDLRKQKSVVRQHPAHLLDADGHLAVEVVVAHHAQHVSTPYRTFGRQDNRAAPWTRQYKPFLRKSAVGRAHNDLAYAQMPCQFRHRRQNGISLVEPGMDCIAQTIRQLIRETVAACPIQSERTNSSLAKPFQLHHAHIISCM